MTGPDPEEVALRLRALLLRILAGHAAMTAGLADLAVAARRFTRAWQDAERRDVEVVLFEHPDLVEVDMSTARWWDTP